MRINRNLADAIVMVSFTVSVLVGATAFDNEVTKSVTMESLGMITVTTLVLRIIGLHRKEEEEALQQLAHWFPAIVPGQPRII